jgi:hypothetical protein
MSYSVGSLYPLVMCKARLVEKKIVVYSFKFRNHLLPQQLLQSIELYRLGIKLVNPTHLGLLLTRF